MVEQTNWNEALHQAALSDIGLRRASNQDAYSVVLAANDEDFRSRGHMFIVADGMGGHAAGELASKLACTGLAHTYRKLVDRSPDEAIRQAFSETNAGIHQRGQANIDFLGMGTTSCVLLLLPEGAVTAHVGDSRIYRLRGDLLEQLTFDHSVVWEMRAAGHLPVGELANAFPKNQITRSLGPHPEVQVDLEGPFPLEPGDTFLLCSDGLTGQVKDEELGVILGVLRPEEAVRTLVDLANLRGGPDNITVVVVRVRRSLAAPSGQTARGNVSAAGAGLAAVPPVLWVVMGVCLLASAGMALTGQILPALLSALGGLVAGGVGLWQALTPKAQNKVDAISGPLGHGPHARRRCAADAEAVARLADIARQLRDAADHQQWQVDWNRFGTLVDSATAAGAKHEYAEAVRSYALAISFMMSEIRSQRPKQALGEASTADL